MLCHCVDFEYQATSGKHSVTLVSFSVCGWSLLIWHSELIHLAFIDRFNEFSNSGTRGAAIYTRAVTADRGKNCAIKSKQNSLPVCEIEAIFA